MKKTIYVMGLSYSHDASVCLLKDWIPFVAIQKERITRKKHDWSISEINLDECIKYCIDYAWISISDIDLFIENSPTILYCKEKDNILWFNRNRMLEDISSEKLIQISHHLAHAYCVYWTSPYKNSAVMIIDWQWNYKEDLTEPLIDSKIFPENIESSYIERESFYEFRWNEYKVIRKNLSVIHKSFIKICWLWHMYEKVASYIFKSRHDAWKLMWLAPYWSNKYDFNIINFSKSWEIIYNNDRVKLFNNPNNDWKLLEINFDEYKNLAYKIQDELERWILFLVKWLKENSESNNLCYSWWVSLNCSSNNIIKYKSWFENIFITPPASDVWISIWCAYYGYLYILKQPKVIYKYLDYLWKEYNNEDIEKSLLKNSELLNFYKSDNIFWETAKLISENNIIWWFQWKSEFWPRALWNRSILWDPRDKDMKDKLNNKVKFRESFRPFAPSVLEEYSDEYFDINNSPYMLLTANVKEEKKEIIPAVVHVDWTSRIQTVNEEQNKKYYNLISEFYKITWIPLVVNTSFNIKDEPIVETPDDAIRCFIGTWIDYLIMGDYIAEKK